MRRANLRGADLRGSYLIKARPRAPAIAAASVA